MEDCICRQAKTIQIYFIDRLQMALRFKTIEELLNMHSPLKRLCKIHVNISTFLNTFF